MRSVAESGEISAESIEISDSGENSRTGEKQSGSEGVVVLSKSSKLICRTV